MPSLAACGGRAAHAKHGPGGDPAAVAGVLQAFGAARVYVMAGDDVLKAGLGVVDSSGLDPAQVRPRTPLLSNVSGNGTRIVIGGSDIDPSEGGFATDGVFELQGDRLTTLAQPGSGLFGPTISSAGKIVAVRAGGGFATWSPEAHRWIPDPRLRHTRLNGLATGVGGRRFAILRANTPAARLIEVTRTGSRDLGSAYCGVLLVASADRPLVATTLPINPPARGACEKPRARVVSTPGRTAELPAGWSPLAWSRGSARLLVAHADEIGVWDPGTQRMVASAPVGTHVWMAAPIWG
ncbi:MAG: hypothetical protein ACJ72E_04130 [Marmoricola sp.]